MRKSIIKQCFIVAFSSILVACATADGGIEEPSRGLESRARDCISQSSIRDYRVLDDSNLIVTGSVRRTYHVALTRRAFGLRSSWDIGFRSPTGMICSNSGEIIVDEGFGPERIRIRSIRELNPDELDELLVRFGKKEPDFEQAPATVEVESAEVEELD